MPRVVIDPGVLVSAAILPGRPPRAVVDAVLDGRCTLIVSPALLDELDEVLHRKLRQSLGYV